MKSYQVLIHSPFDSERVTFSADSVKTSLDVLIRVLAEKREFCEAGLASGGLKIVVTAFVSEETD